NYSLNYSVPFDAWMVAFNASHTTYDQTVAGLSQSYVYAGMNDTQEAKVSRLLYRDEARKITFSLRGFVRETHHAIDDTEVLVQHEKLAALEASVNDHEFIGKGFLDTTVSYLEGVHGLGSLPPPPFGFNQPYPAPKIVTFDSNLVYPFPVGPLI